MAGIVGSSAQQRLSLARLVLSNWKRSRGFSAPVRANFVLVPPCMAVVSFIETFAKRFDGRLADA
ncbi:hypothetical protein [Paenacidovorax monticola]|uniref:Uncharacterized protein n=1 Tax=Paenacidovorax monticola TaxID=1926868 RepID=A0A7H0HED8_9BURK|nr:hypothetical protein [Paenacidovorax monticola]QNP58904.1 hypothetical protein H9L24_18595 [Paenacidovorax monticola]